MWCLAEVCTLRVILKFCQCFHPFTMWQPQRIMITVVIEIPRGMNVIMLLAHKPLDSRIILDQTNFFRKSYFTLKYCQYNLYSILEKNSRNGRTMQYIQWLCSLPSGLSLLLSKADLHSVPLFYIFVLMSSLSPRSAIWDQKKRPAKPSSRL